MESLMNRMNIPSLHGATIRSGMAGGSRSFYGPARIPGLVERRMEEIRRNPRWHARLDALTDAALGGSNLILGATDQGSRGDPNYEGGGTGINIHGERFNVWGGAPGGHAAAKRAQEAQQAQVRRSAEEARARSRASEAEKAPTFNDRFSALDDDRKKLDSALRGNANKLGGAHIYVDFKGVPREVRTGGALMNEGVFSTLKLNRSPQAPQPGGSTTDYNRFSFE
jgi:hypothetical protein